MSNDEEECGKMEEENGIDLNGVVVDSQEYQEYVYQKFGVTGDVGNQIKFIAFIEKTQTPPTTAATPIKALERFLQT